jgi:hypothetical protein
MIFREHDAEMTSSLDCFMHKRLLLLEIGLQIKNAFCPAIGCIRITTGLLALHLQSESEEPVQRELALLLWVGFGIVSDLWERSFAV